MSEELQNTNEENTTESPNQNVENPNQLQPRENHPFKKSWKDYLFEFIVPFLAVTAAFILNSERESYVERQLEKQYLSSMVEDLKLDTSYMSIRRKFIQTSIHRLDTLIRYLNNPQSDNIYKIYNSLSSFLYAGPVFRASDRTLEQLKNTGGLRLIRNQVISDKIVIYDRKIIENIKFQEAAIENARNGCKELYGELFSINIVEKIYEDDFHPIDSETKVALISMDPAVINKFLSRVFALRLVYSNTDKNTYKTGIEYSIEFIDTINKESSH